MHVLFCRGRFISNPFKECLFGAPGSGCRAATELTLLACGSAALKGGPRTPAEGWPPSALPLFIITLQPDLISVLFVRQGQLGAPPTAPAARFICERPWVASPQSKSVRERERVFWVLARNMLMLYHTNQSTIVIFHIDRADHGNNYKEVAEGTERQG